MTLLIELSGRFILLVYIFNCQLTIQSLPTIGMLKKANPAHSLIEQPTIKTARRRKLKFGVVPKLGQVRCILFYIKIDGLGSLIDTLNRASKS